MRAAMIFGRCIESGLTAYEESGRKVDAGVKMFQRVWEEVKLMPEFKDLIYTACEGSWDQLMKSGTQMMKLYEFRAPHLPIYKPLFQQKLRKTIFPGTNLAALENVAVLDILCFPPWNHKMLPKIAVDMNCTECATRWSCSLEADGPPFAPCADHLQRELIIDVKTSGKDFPVDLVALDPQLAEYSWQTRIPDVAFLWFVKCSHGFKKGSKVALLKEVGACWAGWEGLVIAMRGDEEEEQSSVTSSVLLIGGQDALNTFDTACRDADGATLRGKALKAAKAVAIDKGLTDGSIISVSESDVTKQRIQFAAARLTEQDMDEVGRSVAQTTVEMVRAHEQDFYEKQPGVRFPNEKCGFCSMRFHCLHDSDGRDKNLTRKGEEWLDGVDTESE